MAQSYDTSAADVWKTLSDFGGIVRYCPSLSDSVADGTEPGSHRTLTVINEDGSEFSYRERLEAIDHESMSLTYSMPDAGAFPMKDGYRATMHVSERPDGGCLFTWSADVEPADGTRQEVTGFLATVYTTVFDGLRVLHP